MAIPAEWMQRLRRYARIEVTVATHWYPDAGPPSSSRPLDFCLHAGGGSFTYLTRGSSHDGLLPDAAHDRLLEAAQAALADQASSLGVDTAVGRSVTSITVTVHDAPAFQASVRSAVLLFNHLSPEPSTPQPGWASLVQLLASLVAPHASQDDLARWLLLLDALAVPAPLAAPFFEGKAVLCPVDTMMLVPFTESLFLRLGQPPGPTNLLELRRVPGGVALVRRDDGEEVLQQVALARLGAALVWTNEDLVQACVESRGGPYRAHAASSGVAALQGSGETSFRLIVDREGRVALDVRRPSLGLYVQRR